MGILDPAPPRVDAWGPTRWSIVTSLHRPEEAGWNEGWTYLVDAYRTLMERYVRRVLLRSGRRGSVEDEAADVVQAFLADCVEKSWFARAQPQRGKFRAFIQALLRNYVISYLRHAGAQKRRPADGRELVPLLPTDAVGPPSPTDQAELREFDEGWVRVAVERALATLAAENARYASIIRDLMATQGETSEDLGERLGVIPGQLAVLKHRARKRFARLFEAELRATVGDEQDFAVVWRALAPFLP